MWLVSRQLGAALPLVRRAAAVCRRFLSTGGETEFDRDRPAVVVAGDDTIVCWHPPQAHPYEHTRRLPADAHLARRRQSSPLSGHTWRQAASHRQPTPIDLQNMFHAAKHEFLPNLIEQLNMLVPDAKHYVTPVWLESVPYHDALRLQLSCARITASSGRNFLLLLEHPPVYTVGIRTKGYGLDEQHRLEALGAQFVRTARGGLITFHGPGQLVAYPILDLRQLKLGVRDYVHQLEETIMDALHAEFSIPTCRSPDTGVWLQPETPDQLPTAKLAAIGIRVRRHISEHGLALNCNTDLAWFQHIVPCGLYGKNVTSVSNVLGRDVTVQDCVPSILASFALNFGCAFTKL